MSNSWEVLFWEAYLQVSRKCYSLIWQGWEHAQHLPMGSKSLASNMLKGQGQQGHQCLLREPEKYQHQAHAYTHTPFHQMTHCHSVCLSWPTTCPFKCQKSKCGFTLLELFWTHLSREPSFYLPFLLHFLLLIASCKEWKDEVLTFEYRHPYSGALCEISTSAPLA